MYPGIVRTSKVAAYHRKALNIENFSLNSIQNARDANPKRCNIVNCVDERSKWIGQETPESDDRRCGIEGCSDCFGPE